MANLEERLREIMAAKGWRAADLRRISKQSSSLVSQWLSGNVQSISKFDSALLIEAASGYAAMWIAKGYEPKMVGDCPQSEVPLDAAVTALARVVAGASKTQRKQLAALLEALATEPEDRADTCAAILGLLAPGDPYVYAETWEEAARRLANELSADQTPTTPGVFVKLVDRSRRVVSSQKSASNGV